MSAKTFNEHSHHRRRQLEARIRALRSELHSARRELGLLEAVEGQSLPPWPRPLGQDLHRYRPAVDRRRRRLKTVIRVAGDLATAIVIGAALIFALTVLGSAAWEALKAAVLGTP